jgi:hypothetical protein
MDRRGKRAGALVLVLAALALGLSACGGDDSSNEQARTADDAGATATTGPTGSTGATGSDGTREKTGGKGSDKGTGGSKAPSTPSAESPSDSPSQSGSDKRDGKQRSKKRESAVDPNAPSPALLSNLYNQAKLACQALTLNGLAHEYEVPATPEAAARAYSKAYLAPARQKKAVYRGCKDGLT